MNEFLEDHFTKMQAEVSEVRKKYDPLVRRLTNEEFIAIYLAVLDERQRRVVELIRTNPLVRQLAVQDLVDQFKAEEDQNN